MLRVAGSTGVAKIRASSTVARQSIEHAQRALTARALAR
jgi:hypothetical protein